MAAFQNVINSCIIPFSIPRYIHGVGDDDDDDSNNNNTWLQKYKTICTKNVLGKSANRQSG
jgi:hypothetical protein